MESRITQLEAGTAIADEDKDIYAVRCRSSECKCGGSYHPLSSAVKRRGYQATNCDGSVELINVGGPKVSGGAKYSTSGSH